MKRILKFPPQQTKNIYLIAIVLLGLAVLQASAWSEENQQKATKNEPLIGLKFAALLASNQHELAEKLLEEKMASGELIPE